MLDHPIRPGADNSGSAHPWSTLLVRGVVWARGLEPSKPLPPRRVYIRHLARSVALAFSLIGLSLAIGIVGYHVFVGLSWIDSLVDALVRPR